MKKLTWTWKKIVTLICGALGIGTLVSCYGVVGPIEPYEVNSFSLDGKIVDEENKPVQGIQVSVKNKAGDSNSIGADISSLSNNEGYFSLDWYDNNYDNRSFTIDIEDIDGEENGSFDNITKDIEYQSNEKDSGRYNYEKDLGTIQLKNKADNNE